MVVRSALVTLVVLAVGAMPAAASASPTVVASILPVHSLVAAVMAGVGDPVLLVEGGGSPHSYALRPSQARALEQAAAVFWIGEELEVFLVKPLAALVGRARVAALHEAEGVELLPFRGGDAWGSHTHDHEHDHDHDHDHDHEHKHGHGHEHKGAEADGGRRAHAAGEANMHIWLDPANARAIVTAIAATLSEADPAHALTYAANAEALSRRLVELDRSLARALAPLAGRKFVVFHDAYQYLEHRYSLTAVGSITISPDRAPSARKLAAMRQMITDAGAVCVFSEPQFEPAVVRTVIDGLAVRTGVLDPLGADLAPGPDAYFRLMERLADSLRTCLGDGR